MKHRISNTALLLLAAGLLAAGMSSCRKDIEFYRTEGEANEAIEASETKGPAIEFSAYTANVATKGVSYDTDNLLGYWVDSTSTYVPGMGIGVFAFYQKAKSSGYPSNFCKDVADSGPKFMYNQKLERTSTDGANYNFVYSPRKYWPNNTNDQLSFFAYAPYDSTGAWEDLGLSTNTQGDYIKRTFVVYDDIADQKDYLWADPLINKKSSDLGGQVNFNFRHICARVGVAAKVNLAPGGNYVTIDKVTITGRFITGGTMTYTISNGNISWSQLQGMETEKTYVPFEADYRMDPGTGQLYYNTFVVDTTEAYIGGPEGFIFPLPGTQDIYLSATVSQRSVLTSGSTTVRSYEIAKNFPAMVLEGNKAYKFLLNVTLTPINFYGKVEGTWGASENSYTSPDNGQHWY